jgi:membrane-associated phospholipid phosphatase
VSQLLGGIRIDPSTNGAVIRCEGLTPLTINVERPYFGDVHLLQQQLSAVEAHYVNRAERAAEIAAQLQMNPTFWANIVPLSRRATPYTLELMSVAGKFASAVVQQVKVWCNVPRPSEFSPRIQPMIAVPSYSAFPSGHATQAHLISDLLLSLLRPSIQNSNPPLNPETQWRDELTLMLPALATRISENRVIAGIHFPVDSEAGKALATNLLGLLTQQTSVNYSFFKWLWESAQREWGL